MRTSDDITAHAKMANSENIRLLMPVLYTQTVAIRTVTYDEFGKEG